MDGTIPIKPNKWNFDSQTGICSAKIEQDIFALYYKEEFLTPGTQTTLPVFSNYEITIYRVAEANFPIHSTINRKISLGHPVTAL